MHTGSDERAECPDARDDRFPSRHALIEAYLKLFYLNQAVAVFAPADPAAVKLISERFAFRQGDEVKSTTGIRQVLVADYCILPMGSVEEARAAVDATPSAALEHSEAPAPQGCYALAWDGRSVFHANG